ncbi:MAG: T9SS type A sorting domain-containing protein [Crocinitomicaceae bacterium]
MRHIFNFLFLLSISTGLSQFAPAAGQVGSTAIYKDSSVFINWANDVAQFNPGPEDISDPQSIVASFGVPQNALNQAEGNSSDVVSLGDNGSITLSFEFPIINAPGPDFAVFENSFSDTYLEFAFVEVSTNGVDFVRFPATSNIPILVQTGSFGNTDPTLINNLAGKYRQGYGTPFDLEELIDSTSLNLDSITYIKIVDVVGSINPSYSHFDQFDNVINDPFPTAFPSSGFDLDAIGVIYQNNPLKLPKTKITNFNVYPNPAVNQLTITTGESNLNYHVFDIQGRQVMTGIVNSTKAINVQPLLSGTYFLRLSGKEFTEVKKIIVLD